MVVQLNTTFLFPYLIAKLLQNSCFPMINVVDKFIKPMRILNKAFIKDLRNLDTQFQGIEIFDVARGVLDIEIQRLRLVLLHPLHS